MLVTPRIPLRVAIALTDSSEETKARGSFPHPRRAGNLGLPAVPAMLSAGDTAMLDTAADVIDIEYAGPAGETLAKTGTFAEAADLFQSLGVIVLKRAVDPIPLGAIGRTMIEPMGNDPKPGPKLPVFEWERMAGLGRYDLFKAVLGSAAFRMLRALYQSETLLVMEHNLHAPRLQKADAPEFALPFHQDGGACGVPMVRAWFLLSPESCGTDAANIEFAVGSPENILPIERDHPESKVFARLELSHAERDKLLDSCVRWRPSVELGDTIIFKGTTGHRTHFPPGTKRPRLSLETTVYPNRPELYDYIATLDRNGLLLVTETGFEQIKRVRFAKA